MSRLLAYAGRMATRLARVGFCRLFGNAHSSLFVARSVATKAVAGVARVSFRGPLLSRVFRSFTPSSRFTLLRAALVGTSLRWPGTFTMRRYCWSPPSASIRSFAPDSYATTVARSLQASGPSQLEQEAFMCRPNSTLAEYPTALSAYEIGRHISNGCNAVVYEARLRRLSRLEATTSSVDTSASTMTSSLISAGTFGNVPKKNGHARQAIEYPLAIKMMFNYGLATRRDFVFYEMGSELVPACSSTGHMHIREKVLPHPHPNVVKIFTAFVDQVPVLPNAETLYPAALPCLQFDEGYGQNETLYSMTLRDYLLLYKPDALAGVILWGQLLEALLYLSKCRVAHRDLKSNNILVNFDNDQEPPHLVLCDFGSCLSTGSFAVRYSSDDVDLGGNPALRAPEIACARPSRNTVLNYEKADLWASGTIAYEIFTTINPFYAPPPVGLSSATYSEDELPALGADIPWHIRTLIRRVLARNPSARPSVACVANLLVLTLFRAGSILGILRKLQLNAGPTLRLLIGQTQYKVADLVNLFAVETILNCHLNWLKLSHAEAQLRRTFFARLEMPSLMEAAEFLLNLKPAPFLTPSSSNLRAYS